MSVFKVGPARIEEASIRKFQKIMYWHHGMQLSKIKSESELVPSKTKDRYWINSSSPSADWSDTPGKWLLFISRSRIDKVWESIDQETRTGRLGIAAKVSTAMENSLARGSPTALICIYTYDSNDLPDVRRVRDALRALGFTKKIPYKTDSATRAGIYSDGKGTRTSMLFE